MNPSFQQAYNDLVEKVRLDEVSKEELPKLVTNLLKPREAEPENDPEQFAAERRKEIKKRGIDSGLQRMMDDF